MDWHAIRLIGLNSTTAFRLALTAAIILFIVLVRYSIVWIVRAVARRAPNDRAMFWIRQISSVLALAVGLAAVVSIWFDDVSRLTTVAGFATAGLAIAAQRAVTAFAGYLVILRGKSFTVGDRIKMAGVRGDVIALGFLQTRILEMGQPPEVNEQEDPGMWVRARQFSGRVVTVTNDKVFDEAIYNLTRDLPFLWEEISVPVPYRTDRSQRARAEEILIAAAHDAAGQYVDASASARQHFENRYNVALDRAEPRVYWRLTDNWLALTVRFLVPEHGIRDIKDAIARRVLHDFDAANIEIASATFELSNAPVLKVARVSDAGRTET